MHFKKLLVLIILMSIKKEISAQQNLFNVPSSEITTKKHLFFQEQLNINRNVVSNTNFCFGLGKRMEIGFNISSFQTNKEFDKIAFNDSLDGEPLAPLALLTFQKAFKINKNVYLGIGTQLGTNLANRHKNILADFSYLNSLFYFFDEKLKCNLGLFYGDKAVVGRKSELGFMYGAEAVLSKKIHLVVDHIAGNTPIGVSVLGGIYYVNSKFPISLGYQIPNDHHFSSNALVLEFTYVP